MSENRYYANARQLKVLKDCALKLREREENEMQVIGIKLFDIAEDIEDRTAIVMPADRLMDFKSNIEELIQDFQRLVAEIDSELEKVRAQEADE